MEFCNLQPQETYTLQEDAFLQELYSRASTLAILQALPKRSLCSIRNYIQANKSLNISRRVKPLTCIPIDNYDIPLYCCWHDFMPDGEHFLCGNFGTTLLLIQEAVKKTNKKNPLYTRWILGITEDGEELLWYEGLLSLAKENTGDNIYDDSFSFVDEKQENVSPYIETFNCSKGIER